MSIQYDMSELALKILAPSNCLLYDDKNLPSVMVKIPKLKMAQLISGWTDTDEVHPAFIVGNQTLDCIYISKYQNVVNNGRAYSLPGVDPASNLVWDDARGYCEAKGAGWHMMTAAEYALMALICQANGFLPYGNNNYGKDSRDSVYEGIPCTWGTGDDAGKIYHILTGTGPITYSHNKQIDGVWDLNGNVSEWVGGKRTVYGELQLLANNNAADSENPQTKKATTWKAIDATTGAFVDPDVDSDGNYTGQTTNSIKINKNGSAPQWDTTVSTSSSSFNGEFANLTCSANIAAAAQLVLKKYLLLPASSGMTWDGDMNYFNNDADERLFYAGGNSTSGAYAGVAFSFGGGTRATKYATIGFRSAFAPL